MCLVPNRSRAILHCKVFSILGVAISSGLIDFYVKNFFHGVLFRNIFFRGVSWFHGFTNLCLHFFRFLSGSWKFYRRDSTTFLVRVSGWISPVMDNLETLRWISTVWLNLAPLLWRSPPGRQPLLIKRCSQRINHGNRLSLSSLLCSCPWHGTVPTQWVKFMSSFLLVSFLHMDVYLVTRIDFSASRLSCLSCICVLVQLVDAAAFWLTLFWTKLSICPWRSLFPSAYKVVILKLEDPDVGKVLARTVLAMLNSAIRCYTRNLSSLNTGPNPWDGLGCMPWGQRKYSS